MNRFRTALLVSVIGASVVSAGCSSTQAKTEPTTTADLMRGHAEDQRAEVQQKNKIADEWEAGQAEVEAGKKAIREGEEKVRAAEEALREGRQQISRGRTQVEEGNRRTEDALERFSEAYPGLSIDPEREISTVAE